MLQIQETYINQTKGYNFGESQPYEPYTDSRAKLFREFQREYGRCVGKVYRDTSVGTKQVGWVFEKKMEYDDWRPYSRGDRYYIREVWITIFDTEE